MRLVTRASQLTEEQIRGKSRQQDLVAARALFVVEARKRGYLEVELGAFLSGRDHSSVNYLAREYKPSFHYFDYRKRYERLVENTDHRYFKPVARCYKRAEMSIN